MNSVRSCILIVLIAVAGGRSFPQEDLPTGAGDSSEAATDPAADLIESSRFDDRPVFDLLPERERASDLPFFLRIRSRFSQRLQPSAGYRDGKYLGSRIKSYQRLTAGIGAVGGGIVLAKDSGEPFSHQLVSGSLSLRSGGFLRRVVAGDYRLEAGEGIAFWRGRDVSRGRDVLLPASRRARGIVPSVSSDELSYLRGAAVEVGVDNLSGTLIYSHRPLGASVDDNGVVRRFDTDGYYRTPGEIEDYHGVWERLVGGRAEFSLPNILIAGVSVYASSYSRPVRLDGGRFDGTSNMLIEADMKYRFHSTLVFADVVHSGTATGGVVGIALHPSGRASGTAVIRSYPASFFSAHGSGLGNRQEMYDEHGLYLGIRYDLTARATLSVYYDRAFAETGSDSPFPESGEEIFAAFEFRVIPRMRFDVQYRSASADEAEPADAPGSVSRVNSLQKFRLQADYPFSTRGDLRLRYEKSIVAVRGGRVEGGMLAFSDVFLHITRILSANFRLVLFETDSYAARLAEYERDLDGVASVPAMFGTGIRWYLLVKVNLGREIRLGVKYSETIRDDTKYIGSGLESLLTNRDNRLAVQLDVRF